MIKDSLLRELGYRRYYDAKNLLDQCDYKYNAYYEGSIIIIDIVIISYSGDVIDLSFKYNPERQTIYDFKCEECFDEGTCIHQVMGLIIINDNFNDIENTKKQLTSTDLLNYFKDDTIIKSKEFVNLDIEISNYQKPRHYYEAEDEVNFEYEIKFKVGTSRMYLLKNKLNNFINVYNKKEGYVEFGKEFTYNPNNMEFVEEDQRIIDFTSNFFYAYKTGEKAVNRYNNSDNVKAIILAEKQLSNFLSLLTFKKFKFNGKTYHGISDKFDARLNLKKHGKDYKLEYHLEGVIPVTEDYEYIIYGNNFYKLDKESSKLLGLMLSNATDNIVFDEKDINQVGTIILPRLKNLTTKLELDDEIEDKFVFDQAKIKYYFDVSHGLINAKVVASYGEYDFNPLDQSLKADKKVVVRDKEKEREALELLFNHKFELNNKKDLTLKNDEDILEFITSGIVEFNTNHDTYVSEKLKKLKIYPSSKVRSNISLGQDELLSYEFSIENVNTSEIDDLINAVKLRRKYYKLKSGSFINLDNNEDLMKFASLAETLDLTRKDLELGKTNISKYKSLYLAKVVEEEDVDFIKSDDEFNKFINKFKEYQASDLKLSKESLKVLRDYQVTGVKWLHAIKSCGFGGILADEMGLGKTLEAITYIENIIKEDKNRKILIVTPTSLIYNWEAEFDKFAPNINKVVINDSKEKRIQLIKELNKYNVVITSYGMLRQDIEDYEVLSFDTMIIDEAQAIKNLNTQVTKTVKKITAQTKFALTGTPIENSLYELYSIFEYIMPGFMPGVTKFTQKYANNIEKNPDKNVIAEFNKLISPFILRRKKQDVLKDLPDKITTVRVVDLNESQKRLYLSQLENVKKSMKELDYNKDKIKILAALTRLRQICIDPAMFIEDYQGGSAKIEAVVDLIESAVEGGHKLLLFSQFTSALAIFKKELDKKKIIYHYLDGQTKSKDRLEMVNSFDKDDKKIFMLSLKAGGVGLNLVAADIVIHLDPWWNPQVENQATDRTHRIGQTNVVEVIKMVAKGTIEEKIVKLQEKKKELSDTIIEADNRDEIILNKLSEKEFKELLDI